MTRGQAQVGRKVVVTDPLAATGYKKGDIFTVLKRHPDKELDALFYVKELDGVALGDCEVEYVDEADLSAEEVAESITEPRPGMRVFSKPLKEGMPTINTVVEFPLDPRIWLAGMAMQAMLTRENFDPALVAQEAESYADALLARLAQTGGAS